VLFKYEHPDDLASSTTPNVNTCCENVFF